jgi:hypothetical protein
MKDWPDPRDASSKYVLVEAWIVGLLLASPFLIAGLRFLARIVGFS